MDIKTAAQRLHGMEYRDERPYEDVFKEMKDAGLVAVTGASDDLVEFYGAIRDERDIGETLLADGAILESSCPEGEDCPYFRKFAKSAIVLEARFGEMAEPDAPTWTFTIPVEHETFDVMEEGEIFSRGIVFRTSDIP
ncbi:hypothetical protein [Salipiger mucosus]|uniref:Uncharacterized protein n=1 Tax=Salipiger mucosus DSM 16094 TaxID=1123237 RepID=S9Q9S4_9RHOB|nr:hypothetical protein [Salipiger mucosus]EPX76752.1 hypothetical protein Salmuc_04637 [Salipiger mucosus DSM 16094]